MQSIYVDRAFKNWTNTLSATLLCTWSNFWFHQGKSFFNVEKLLKADFNFTGSENLANCLQLLGPPSAIGQSEG
ncbi:hypothetical protein LDENG_00120350 [Lucifuga dentata]|nr:hypothetical protein LDENG_00120350 [Lucifuga dentata]